MHGGNGRGRVRSAPWAAPSSWFPRPVRRTLLAALVMLPLVGFAVPNGDDPVAGGASALALAGSFGFGAVQADDPDRPVTYDPCRPIRIQVNDRLAPAGTWPLLEAATDEVAALTGLEVHLTDRTRRRLYDHNVLRMEGHLRIPVLVDWTTPRELPGLSGETAGLAGSTMAQVDGQTRYVTGTVALDAPDLKRLLDRPDGPAQVEGVIKHELGHLLGLEHVDDPAQLMHGDNLGTHEFGPGDRAGLARLGSGRCVTDASGPGE